MNNHIFWVASYPKSGNTLIRSILSSLFFSKDGIFEFDLLKTIVNFEEISRFKYVKNLDSKNFENKTKLGSEISSIINSDELDVSAYTTTVIHLFI